MTVKEAVGHRTMHRLKGAVKIPRLLIHNSHQYSTQTMRHHYRVPSPMSMGRRHYTALHTSKSLAAESSARAVGRAITAAASSASVPRGHAPIYPSMNPPIIPSMAGNRSSVKRWEQDQWRCPCPCLPNSMSARYRTGKARYFYGWAPPRYVCQ